jgi:hypothetical protein
VTLLFRQELKDALECGNTSSNWFDRDICSSFVKNPVSARMPTTIAPRFIEYFNSMLGPLLMSATPVSHVWQYQRWLGGSLQP